MHIRHRTGFTLIELLVVIAIIAILAAILFPVFAKAKKSAVRASCLSNLKQLSIAAQNYADTYNGNYPSARIQNWPFGDWNDSTVATDGYGLRALIPYVKNKQVFFCRSNSWFGGKGYDYYWKKDQWFAGYLYWGNYTRPGADGKPLLSDRQIAKNTGHDPYSLLISDFITGGGGVGWNSHDPNEMVGGNLLYNDGHAKWKFTKEMKELCTIVGPPSVTFYY